MNDNEYEICTDFFEIISGSSKVGSIAYTEARSIANDTPAGFEYLKNFITSIENIAGKENVKDERISSTRGNIEKFQGYNNIVTAMEFLENNLGRVGIVKDLRDIYESLKSCQSEYMDGYRTNCRLIILEYESALYLLVTGLSMGIATNIDIVQNGRMVKIRKKFGRTLGTTEKTISNLAKQLGEHKHREYLKGILDAQGKSEHHHISESTTYTESIVTDTLDAIEFIFRGIGKIGGFAKKAFLAIKNSIFGIVPLIRSICYLRYKKKADTVAALNQQCDFIRNNIDRLQKRTNIDEKTKKEIIKKQEAYITAYQKKAEKLRAELTEGEREAATAAKKDEPKLSNIPKPKNNDGELVLEDGTLFSLNV